MTQAILKMEENRVRRAYTGGAGIEKLHRRKPVDSDCPEEWLGSVVEANNIEMPYIKGEGISKVKIDGQLCGLDEIIRQSPEYYLGKAHYEALGIQTGFLVKYLDSAMRLALQAHPDRRYAAKYLNSRWGKMECYYILDVREGVDPYIYLGFQHAPEKARWRSIVLEQDLEAIEACFERIHVEKGEFWYIPSGLVHAIGEGITMIEIMEPSDWVVRCEFERCKGKRFPEHARYMGKSIDEVMEIFDFQEYPENIIRKKARLEPKLMEVNEMMSRVCMISEKMTDCFRVEKLTLFQNGAFEKPLRPALLIVLEGNGTISCGGMKAAVQKGEALFIAASEPVIELQEKSEADTELCLVMPKAYEDARLK